MGKADTQTSTVCAKNDHHSCAVPIKHNKNMFAGLIIYIGVVSFFALLQLYRYIFTDNSHKSHQYDTKSLLMHVFILSYILAVVLTFSI
jgi:hypothetical protein